LVVLEPGDPAPQSLSLVAGLALIETVDLAEPGQPLMLKWPNDLLLNGKKLSGILLERSADRIVIGFGVNLASAPDLEERAVASLSGRLTPQAFAPLLAGSFARLVSLWRTTTPALLAQAWLARAHALGTRMTVHNGDGALVSGRFHGLEPDGALRLRTEAGGLETVRAADISIG
jgi:BirA family biotin operon repressor/biotin-[acetyl-CoA-carboxylase] ligase